MKVLTYFICATALLTTSLFAADLIQLLDKKTITANSATAVEHDLAIAQENLQKLTKEHETAQISLHAAMLDNEQTCAEFKTKIETLQQELDATKQLCAMTEKAYQAMMVERDNAYELAKVAHADRSAALQEKNTAEHERAQAIASCTEGEQALSAANTIIKQEKYRVKMLQGKLEKQMTTNKQLEEQITAATSACDKTTTQLNTAQTALEKEKILSAQLTQQLDAARSAHEHSKQELKKQIATQDATIKHLQESLAAEHAAKEELEKNCTAACQRETMIEADKEQLAANINELKKDVKKRALSIALHCNSIKGRLLERGRTTFGQVQEMLDTLVVPEVKRLKTIVS